MPVILKPGQKRRGYEIVRELDRGSFTISYEARSPSGERVFLKQYKSPSTVVPWYRDFVDHQNELKGRIESDPNAKESCCRFVEFFEDNGFYQVFEFVTGGRSLDQWLTDGSRCSWEQLALFSTIMMLGVRYLHGCRIVHTCLRPGNIMLVPDSAIRMGHKLRLIELDWAVLSDRQAPWHGQQGYVGSPGYQSPEHLRGDVPLPASDVFACALILGETLGQGHPFKAAGDNYPRAAMRGEFEPIRLRQDLPRVSERGAIESLLNACLDPDPTRRPTAAQMSDALRRSC